MLLIAHYSSSTEEGRKEVEEKTLQRLISKSPWQSFLEQEILKL